MNEHPNNLMGVGVQLHAMGLSVREVAAVLGLLGVDRSHGAVWNWTHNLAEIQDDLPTAETSRVAVDENQIEVGGEEKRLCAAVDTELKLLLEIDVYNRPGTDPAAAFLIDSPRNTTSETVFLVDDSAIRLPLLGLNSAVGVIIQIET